MRKHLSTFLILLFLQSSAYGAVLVAPSSTVPDATETVKGKVELATDAETVTGTDDTRATTPAGVTAKMSAPGAIGDITPDVANFTTITLIERSADPDAPAEGKCIVWMSDGTGKGNAGDVMLAVTAGGVTKYASLFDHSSGADW